MLGYEKSILLDRGISLAKAFCERNKIEMPDIKVVGDRWRVSACAYYRPTTISICPILCANVGLSGQAWSWPGHSIDRTPYGVIAHELGHHYDFGRGGDEGQGRPGRYFSEFSKHIRGHADEAPISGYLGVRMEDGREDPISGCAEWFAEMFRLFVTNPDLLRLIRPRTFASLRESGLEPVVDTDWKTTLADAPARTIAVCEKRINEMSAAARKAAQQASTPAQLGLF
jgi:hypothetical protein